MPVSLAHFRTIEGSSALEVALLCDLSQDFILFKAGFLHLALASCMEMNSKNEDSSYS